MPGANLAAYLAKKYLTATTSQSAPQSDTVSSDFLDSTRPKKKRRKNKDDSAGSGLVIADDDEDVSLRSTASRGRRGEEYADDIPTFETSIKSAEFRKKKGGGAWKVIATPASTTGQSLDNKDEDNEADRILAQAAEESRLRRQEIEDEDAPMIVEEDGGPRMQSGVRAGLQTAADTAALVAKEEREKQRDLESLNPRSKSKKHKDRRVEEEETIYRDATGRRIDISLKRAEARAAAEEKVRAERKAKEEAMGDVQRREREERKKELQEAKFLSLARGVDDEAMNEELRAKVRWDDPMAGYLAQQKAEEADGTLSTRKSKGDRGGKAGVRKKVYTGPPAAPNRYGILPGWRWDGVDRSNGFEKEWFQARSKRGREEELRFQWQMDE
ncbi:uncharacterized protein Z519_04067 [Cladophialophora bantiana CBS 173.52]|uniref:Pre-mRNA-splicing factor cwc26 n=1 Tax=Cladophialophora bantiana (strain ATCC 10958 / CBS 173.52 / CDC B-1940 / NIH 8579) TaxID=1442370 RepID=A0A0D2GA93_CLAB1|nr:uncharacterized protein Z519_04067 [Cladophialophora bantiana CBS 173.52]KIW95482.1 hypothetical protein Z519_04067 [Cladophialophora bantiana CBS 173.52]